jgi:ribosomal protein S18 acetylase RimI-like enzyme
MARVISPMPQETEVNPTVEGMLGVLDDELRRRRIRVAYVFLGPQQTDLERPFTSSGYDRTQDVLSMSCPVSGHGPTRSQPMQYVPCAEVGNERMIDVFAETFRASQDFPLPAGHVEPRELLMCLAESGDSGTDYWYVVSEGTRDIGCLLLADHSERGICELAYFGVSAKCRGRGYGRGIVGHAFQLAAGLGREHVFWTVSSQNDPAIAVYASLGSDVIGRHRVFWKCY